MTARGAWLCGGAAILVAAGAALAQGSGDPAENWAKVAACARIDRASERQACVDAVFRAAGLLDREREVAEQRKSFGETKRPPPPPTPPTAPAPAVARAPAPAAPAPVAAPQPAAPPAELDQLATTVSRAFDPGNRLMVIVTQEGQIWQQNESKDIGLPPKPGTQFTVKKGSLGSFVCQVGKGRTFRCRRQG